MKKTLLAGLSVLLPIALTFLLFIFLIDFLTAPFLDLIQDSAKRFAYNNFSKIPLDLVVFFTRLFILFVLVLLTCFIGFVGRKFFFRSLIELTQNMFAKIPFLRSVFKVTTEITKALFHKDNQQDQAFKKPALVPFPSRKSSCVGFVSGSIPKVCEEKIPGLVPVFVPTSPHPISGYMMMVPKKEALDMDMTNEEAVKFTVSCGMITSR